MKIAATALLLALAAAAAATSCGGNKAKADLHAYESAMESLVAEDGRVSASLADLKADLFADNARSEDQARFARETAGPFYARFRTAAAAVPAEDPRLDAVHGILLQYVDRRVAYLAAIETCLAAAESPPMKRLLDATLAVGEVRRTLEEKTGRKIDREAADAWQTAQLFIERVMGGFTAGKVDAAFVTKALTEQVVPRLVRVSSRVVAAGDDPEAVVDRAVVEWARGELSYFQVLLESLPVQEKAHRALRETEEHWASAEELKAKYIGDLGAYRESIR